MTLEARARLIADKACPMTSGSYRHLGIYHLALRMLKEAISQDRAESEKLAHKDWVGM